MSTDPRKTTTIDLQHELTTGQRGKAPLRFGPGKNIKVPENMAEDLLRRDHEYSEYERNLHVKRTSEVNAGTMSVGGGE